MPLHNPSVVVPHIASHCPFLVVSSPCPHSLLLIRSASASVLAFIYKTDQPQPLLRSSYPIKLGPSLSLSLTLRCIMSRPSLGSRSISEQAPLYDPSSAPHSGSRLRGSKTASGAHTATGSQLPYSPLLPLPPASTPKLAPRLADLVDAEQAENVAPSHALAQHGAPASASALAARRLARRGLSEGYGLHFNNIKLMRSATVLDSVASALGTKAALRLDIPATSDLAAQPVETKSAGMIRSYSLPVATQEEHDEQQRIMALGLSPVGRYTGNTAWWQYGWPSPGGVNHRHIHRSPATPRFPSQRRRSSQSKLSNVMTPTADAQARVVSAATSPCSVALPIPSQPAKRTSKTHSSCSPKMKNKYLPSIHQHSFQNSSSRSASSSPKTGRSPLAMMSVNLPATDQQQGHIDGVGCAGLEQGHDKNNDDDDDKVAATPVEAAFDIEMDALNQRFAEWSRSLAMATPSACAPRCLDQDDYFNLVHDDQPNNGLLGVGGGSDTSDEARTPRASSPRPLSKAALFRQEHDLLQPQGVVDHDERFVQTDRWSGSFDFIHPDHLG